jgi:hypothetical protein
MNLLRGRLIKAWLFTPLPMREEVIKQLEEMATTNYLSQQGETDTHLDSMAASEEYQPSHQEDHVSLRSSDYSKISQNELNDITIEGRAENEEDMDAIIPETILSDNNISTDVPRSQGVDDNAEDKNDNLPQASDIEGVEEDANDKDKEDTLEHQKYISHLNTGEDNNKVDNILDNDNNSYDSGEQEDMAECITNN